MSRQQLNLESGFALPVALLLMAIITAAAAVLSQHAVEQFRISQGQEASYDTFHVSEAAMHEALRQLSLNPEAWRSMAVMSDNLADDYTFYQPADYAESNGIPSCSQSGCLRSYAPVGGGPLKNVGPINSEGADVDDDYSFAEQLDPQDPPTADITINNLGGWTQIERLETVFSDDEALGSNLSSQGDGWGNAEVVRYRVSSYALRDVKARTGQATLISVVEYPAS